MGYGFDDYMLTHTIEQLHAGVDIDTVEEFDDPIFEDIQENYENWKTKKDEAATTPVIGRVNCTDMGNAERLSLREAGNIKWSQDVGWRYFDGKRWMQDRTHNITARAAACVRKIYAEANQTKDQERRESLGKWAVKSEAAPRINAMIDLCRSIVAVDPSIWDTNTWLLNLKNGTLDLETGEFREHRKEDFITKFIDVDYDHNATCPIWKNFLNRVIENPEDQRFLQKAVGYSLTGSIREQCFFILYGLGSNGKSTFINTIESLLGDYAKHTSTETLMIKHNDGGIPNDIAQLQGARFVCAIETEGNKRLAESLVKSLTGGDKINARFLHHEFFTFAPTFKIWLAVNHEPRIHGTDEGIWRRIRLIPFEVQIPTDEQDEELPQKLLAELPGILAWAIEGTNLWLSQKLGTTAAVKSATTAYREKSDALNTFIEECCTLTGSTLKNTLYEKYVEWCKQSGEYTVTKRNFGTRMIEKGFKDKKNVNWFWLDISLGKDDEPHGQGQNSLDYDP